MLRKVICFLRENPKIGWVSLVWNTTSAYMHEADVSVNFWNDLREATQKILQQTVRVRYGEQSSIVSLLAFPVHR